MNQPQNSTSAMIWIISAFVFLDIALGLFRCLSFMPSVIDPFIAIVGRTQLCLLMIWLAVGKQRLRWRLAGLVTCLCFLLMLFTRLMFPWQGWDFPVDWSAPQWSRFFGSSGPGELLINIPALIVVVVLPLGVCRVIQRWLQKQPSDHSSVRWFQISFQDLFILVAMVSVVLGAVFCSAPYKGWFQEVGDYWLEITLLKTADAQSSFAYSLLHSLIALISLRAVYSPRHVFFRVCSLIAAVVVFFGFHSIWSSGLLTLARGVVVVDNTQQQTIIACGVCVLLVATLAIERLCNEEALDSPEAKKERDVKVEIDSLQIETSTDTHSNHNEFFIRKDD